MAQTPTSTPTSDIDFGVDFGRVPVDSGRLLILDPRHLPTEVVSALTTPCEHGVSAGIVVATPAANSLLAVAGFDGDLVIFDPYADEVLAPWQEVGQAATA